MELRSSSERPAMPYKYYGSANTSHIHRGAADISRGSAVDLLTLLARLPQEQRRKVLLETARSAGMENPEAVVEQIMQVMRKGLEDLR